MWALDTPTTRPGATEPAARGSLWTAANRLDRYGDGLFEAVRQSASLLTLMVAASKLGLYSLLWYALGAVGLALSSEADRQLWLVFCVAMPAEFALTNGVLKRVVSRPRPQAALMCTRINGVHVPRTTSFPSGHSSAAALAAVLLAGTGGLGTAAAVLAALIATSRVVLRLHYVSDVLAGVVLGVLVGAMLHALI